MEEILLQTIIDKLETLANAVEKLGKAAEGGTNYSYVFNDLNEKIGMLQTEVQNIPGNISIPSQEIVAHRATMVILIDQLKKPLQQKVKQIISLNVPFQLCVILLGVIIWLSTWIFILYHSDHTEKSEKSLPSVTLPPVKNLILSPVKLNKARQKKVASKTYIQDSIKLTNKIRLDSIYEKLLLDYQRKHGAN